MFFIFVFCSFEATICSCYASYNVWFLLTEKGKKTFINKIKRSKILVVMIKPRLRPKIQLDWKSLKVLLLILTWKCNFWRLNISFFYNCFCLFYLFSGILLRWKHTDPTGGGCSLHQKGWKQEMGKTLRCTQSVRRLLQSQGKTKGMTFFDFSHSICYENSESSTIVKP